MALSNIFGQISQTYQGNRLYFNVAGVSVFFLLIFFDVIQALMMNLLALLYLGYQTMELLNEDEPDQATQITVLKKWATYATFLGMEQLAELVMFWPLSWVYPFGKLMLYLWVVNDSQNVSSVYDGYIEPLYLRHRPLVLKIMTLLEGITSKLGVHVNELFTDVLNLLKEYQVLGSLLNMLSFGSLSALLDTANEALGIDDEEETKED